MAGSLPLSIVCTTWNRADYLEKVLIAYAGQTVREFEFIVADDGSTDDTEARVGRVAAEVPFPVKYVRHDNQGFRKAATVNLGVRHAETDYLFVTDCDSLPHADLLEQHARAAAPGRLVLGECIRLTKDFTRELSLEAIRAGDYQRAWTRDADRELCRLQRRARFYAALRFRRKPRMRGNNFSLFMADFRAVNGYDERFVGWGNEDGDLRERLKRAGVRPFPVVHRAVTYHMWHQPHDTRNERPNQSYAWSGGRRPFRCDVGLEQVSAGEEAEAAHRT